MTAASEVTALPTAPAADPHAHVSVTVRVGGTGAVVMTREEIPPGDTVGRMRLLLLDNARECAAAVVACDDAEQGDLGEALWNLARRHFGLGSRAFDAFVAAVSGDDYAAADTAPDAFASVTGTRPIPATLRRCSAARVLRLFRPRAVDLDREDTPSPPADVRDP
ncbi:hypothetical protein OG948_59545 (plasmid) [Embleya sp. NBC_00888]|uniref:hypothetical protein n=1 Tax=Embleya sp. NBC_00888 TaxID=2975960 RepID=UPI002F91AF5B|nr:hypothetical protein OG948_59545 [Embleya sp. NBC_00888]